MIIPNTDPHKVIILKTRVGFMNPKYVASHETQISDGSLW